MTPITPTTEQEPLPWLDGLDPKYAQFLTGLVLESGSHNAPGDGQPPSELQFCVMEAVAYVANEPWSDRPQCASPVLTDFCINLNDNWSHKQRQELMPFVPRIVGTRDDGLDETRSYLALDWLIRTYTPAWLDLAGLTAEAAELRTLRRIADMVAAKDAAPVVKNAQTKAYAAWDAARVAARVAAGVAAGVAAWDAARVAARVADGDAARDAAGDAARVAAGVAAGDALNPTVEILQASALDLLDRMIDGRWAA